MTFDRKISIGTVVQVLSFLGAAAAVWMAMERRMTASEAKVTFIEKEARAHEDREGKRLERIEEKIDLILAKRGR